MWGVKLTGIGLFLDLNGVGVGFEIISYGCVFGNEKSKSGVAVNRYRFLFGTEWSSSGACS